MTKQWHVVDSNGRIVHAAKTEREARQVAARMQSTGRPLIVIGPSH